MVELSSELFGSAEYPHGGAKRAVQLAGDALFYPYFARITLLDVLARWLVHRVVFQGGWTVYVDAPDRDPVKVRFPDRDQAAIHAQELAARIDTEGVSAVDALT